MKQKKYVFIEVLCIAGLAAFITMLCLSRAGGTQKELSEVAAPVVEAMQEGEMNKKSNADAAKTFQLDLTKTEDVVYYSNDNIMDVSELLIVKLKDSEDASEFEDAIKVRINDRKNLYKSYAPEQYSLLNNSIVEVSGNTVFYCTSQNADKLYDVFKNAL